jgi:hypothetical protein
MSQIGYSEPANTKSKSHSFVEWDITIRMVADYFDLIFPLLASPSSHRRAVAASGRSL